MHIVIPRVPTKVICLTGIPMGKERNKNRRNNLKNNGDEFPKIKK